jgi:hypothetical protein
VHGNVTRALERLESDLELPEKPSIATEKLFNGVAELHTYIRNTRTSSRTTVSATGKERGSARPSGVGGEPIGE